MLLVPVHLHRVYRGGDLQSHLDAVGPWLAYDGLPHDRERTWFARQGRVLAKDQHEYENGTNHFADSMGRNRLGHSFHWLERAIRKAGPIRHEVNFGEGHDGSPLRSGLSSSTAPN